MRRGSPCDSDEYAALLKYELEHLTLREPENPPPGGYMDKDAYKEIAQCGDVLLFSANDDVSKLIRATTGGAYHHVALVFKGQLSGEPKEMADKVRLFMATYGTYTVDYEGHTGEECKEVMIVDFDTQIMVEETTYVRRLECSQQKRDYIVRGLTRFAEKTLGDQYTLGSGNWRDMMMIIESMMNLPSSFQSERKEFSTWVCSTLTGHALIEAGILNKRKHPVEDDIQMFPGDFASDRMNIENGDFARGFNLGKEIKLEYTPDAQCI